MFCRCHRKLLNGPSRYIRWSKFLSLNSRYFYTLATFPRRKCFIVLVYSALAAFIEMHVCLQNQTNSDTQTQEVTELSNVYEPIELRFEVLRTTVRNRPKLSGILNLEISRCCKNMMWILFVIYAISFIYTLTMHVAAVFMNSPVICPETVLYVIC